MKKGLSIIVTLSMLLQLMLTAGFAVSAIEGSDEFNFNTAGNKQGWLAAGAVSGGTVSGGSFNATSTATSTTPYLFNISLATNGSNYNIIKVGLKYSNIVAGSVPKIYFNRSAPQNDASLANDSSRMVAAAPLTETTVNNFIELTFKMSNNANWNGATIRELKLYPFDAIASTSTYSIDYIKLVNIATYTITYDANAGSETVLNLPASASALTGSTFPLNPAATILRKNYNFLGWSKTTDNSTGLITSLVPEENTTVYAIWELNPPLATSWNFESDASDWTADDAAVSVAGGLLTVDTAGTTGAAVSPSDLCIDASKYKIIKVGMVHTNTVLDAGAKPSIWFKTSSSNSWGDTKTVEADITYGGASGSDIQQYTFDMSSSLAWSGIVEQIKLPFAAAGNYKIDYVRVYKFTADDDNLKVSFNIGSAASIITHAPYSISAPAGTELTLPSNAGFYRSGYTFKGWAITPTSSDTLSTFTVPATNSTLYAVWAPKSTSGVSAEINPANGSVGVYPKDNAIRYRFDTPMLASTMTPSNFSSTYFQKVIYDPNTFTATCYFKPDVTLYGTTINFTPSSAILSIDGTSFAASAYSIKFASMYENNGQNFLSNGDFSDPNHIPMFNVSGMAIQFDAIKASNVLYIPGSSSNGYTQPKIKIALKSNTKYVVSFSVRVLKNLLGEDITSDTYTPPSNLYYSYANHVNSPIKLSTAMGWQSGSYTITTGEVTSTDSQLWFFSIPFNNSAVSFMLDDVSIVEVPTITFKGGYNAIGEAPVGFGGDYALGASITLPANTYTKTNYNFKCWTDDKGKTVQPGENYIIAGSPVFTATWEPMAGFSLYTAAFNVNGATGTAPASISLMNNDNTGEYETLVLPGVGNLVKIGYQFIGWGDTASATVPSSDTYLTADKTYYAIWKLLDSWVFNDADGTQKWTTNASNITVVDNALTIDMSGMTDPIVISPALGIPAANYKAIEFVYKTSKINDNYTTPMVYFTTSVNGVSSGWTADRVFNGNPKPTVANEYTTLTINTLPNANWKGIITGLRFDPFDIMNPENPGAIVSIQSIRFIPGDSIEGELITTLDAPETRAAPTNAVVGVGANYTVSKTEWYPAVKNNKFSADTVYTAKVTLFPKTGFRFSNETTAITINGASRPATKNEDGGLTVSYTFPKTYPLYETDVEIIAPYKEITRNGGIIKLTAKVTSPQVLDDYSVIWTVDNPLFAKIDKDGYLTAINNGTVIVTATSNYDNTKSDSITISISGQSPVYTVTYLANAGSDVVLGMPPTDTYAKGSSYALSKATPEREGHRFVGWSTDPYGSEFVTVMPITKNTQVYAIWYETPYGWEFISDAGGWSAGINISSFGVTEGVLAVVSSATIPDPSINFNVNDKFKDLNLEDYNVIEVGMAHDFVTASIGSLLMFFMTDTFNTQSFYAPNPPPSNPTDWYMAWQNAALRGSPSISGKSSNGNFVVYKLNAANNTKWTGKLKSFRFDFIDQIGSVKIDYIRFIKSSASIKFMENAGSDTVIGMPQTVKRSIGTVNLAEYAKPTRTGYRFAGWALRPEIATAVTNLNLYTDTNLYAIWQPFWNFKKTGDALGWTADASTTLTALYGRLKGVYNGSDVPKLYSPDFAVSAANIRFLTFDLRFTAATGGTNKVKIYFQREGDTNFVEDQCLEGEFGMSGATYRHYFIDLTRNANWNGAIKKLCIVPMNGSGTYEITNIQLSFELPDTNPTVMGQIIYPLGTKMIE